MILTDTLGCAWEPAKFLIFADLNVFGTLVYYSHLFAFVTAAGLGLFVYFNNPRSLNAKIFAGITALFSVWVMSDLVLWANERPDLIMFFWTITILVEPAIYTLGLYFLLYFINGSDIGPKPRYILLLLLAPTIIFGATRLGILGFNYTNCDREVVEGVLVYYGYIIEIAMAIWAVIATWRAFKISPSEKRRPLIFIALGIISFFFCFAWGNIVGTISEDWTLGQYGLFGMPILFGFMTYSIVKFRTFNIKVIAAQALILTLGVITASVLFLRTINSVRIVMVPTILLVFILGYYLIRSVKREVQHREELARLNAELATANVKLTDLNRQKTELVSFANHDLQSPINKVKQYASLVIDGTYKGADKIMDTVGKIRFQAEEALKMVANFLDLRKIEEGQMPFTPETKDIVAFVRDIVTEGQLAATNRNIALSFVDIKAAINVSIDTTQMRQVIENLISNSLKYTEPGTPDGKKTNWIKVSVTEEQKSALISIQDSGLGMDKELLPILFEQFRRDPGVAKKIQGTGLGLYITKKFVIGHRGEIWAESPGKGLGSTFFVRLPKA